MCDNFELNANNWELYYGADWSSGQIRVQTIEDEYFAVIQQSFGRTLDNGWYRVQLTVSIPNGVDGSLSVPLNDTGHVVGAGIGTEGSGLYIGLGVDSNNNTMLLYTVDVNYENDPTTNYFTINCGGNPGMGNIYIESVSLKQYI